MHLILKFCEHAWESKNNPPFLPSFFPNLDYEFDFESRTVTFELNDEEVDFLVFTHGSITFLRQNPRDSFQAHEGDLESIRFEFGDDSRQWHAKEFMRAFLGVDVRGDSAFVAMLLNGISMLGLSERGIADRVGVTRISVNRWTEGKNLPFPGVRDIVKNYLIDCALQIAP